MIALVSLLKADPGLSCIFVRGTGHGFKLFYDPRCGAILDSDFSSGMILQLSIIAIGGVYIQSLEELS